MSLEVVCGPMFSGKSSYIYSIVKRYASIGVNVLVVKPSIDTRYSAVPEVVTHDGVRFECVTVASQLMTLPFSVTDGPNVIVIEEAQFFRDLVVFVKSMVDRQGKTVVVVGLDGDSNRNPFGQILACIPLADKVTKLTALCSECMDGTPALFTYRTVSRGGQVLVGGADMYRPLCRSCYNDAMTAE
jgi:thymidine kinase